MIDPVCGLEIPDVSADAQITYEHNSTFYRFCSTDCQEEFINDPEYFLNNEGDDEEDEEPTYDYQCARCAEQSNDEMPLLEMNSYAVDLCDSCVQAVKDFIERG